MLAFGPIFNASLVLQYVELMKVVWVSVLWMDVLSLPGLQHGLIKCVEMHTTGEPTRIVIQGFPAGSGTLLEQRSQAKAHYDHIRRRLMLEPRGHVDMYGAILRQETELTAVGKAHMGVLFVHNEGYSTMCGHATIALGRFLLDTHDLDVFPRRNEITHDPQTLTAQINLHAPCGLIRITVPTTNDGKMSDPCRPVSFMSVPSFATAVDVAFEVPEAYKWPELMNRPSIRASVAYGGAFYCLVTPLELGFPEAVLRHDTKLHSLSEATKQLKDAISKDRAYQKYITHPDHDDLSFLYGVVVVDKGSGAVLAQSTGAETGLCFFADQEVDRSPTGSAVAARVALAFQKGELQIGESWTYHSLVSHSVGGKGGFVGTVSETQSLSKEGVNAALQTVRVCVEGFAYYTGSHVFLVEQDDPIGDDGFILGK